MNQLYIVGYISSSYEYVPQAVFSTSEKAEEFISSFIDPQNFEIDPIVLDPVKAVENE